MIPTNEEDCGCCDISKTSEEVLSEISSFIGPGNVAGEKQVILEQLKQIDVKLQPTGGISDIVALAERFFAVNFDGIKPSQLEPKDDDLSKEIGGKHKIKDITDNPFIDPSKAIDFSGLDLSKLSNIKISLTLPTLTVVKKLKFGPVSIGIKFQISLKEIYWGPTIEVDVNSIDKALAVLKKSVVTDLVTPSMGKNIKDLRELAQAQLKTSNPAAAGDLSLAQTTDEFFNKLANLQLNIYETVNLGDKAEKIIKDNEQVAKIIKDNANKEVGNKLVTESNDLKNIEHCEPRTTEFAKFNETEILKVISCEEAQPPIVFKLNEEIQAIKDEAAEVAKITGADEAIKQKKAVDGFLSCINAANVIMQECNTKKIAAQNKQWFFKEIENLHKYTHEYTAKQYSLAPDLDSPYIAIIKERDRLLKKKAEETAILLISPTAENKKALESTNGELSLLEANFNRLITTLYTDINGKLKEILKDPPIKLNKPYKPDVLQLRLDTLRAELASEKNPLSNLVGFDKKGKLVLYVGKDVYKETKIIESSAKSGTPAPIFDDYFRQLDFDFLPVQPKIRSGLLELGLWKKFYSGNRIDNLFTWEEQGYTAPKPAFNENGTVLGKKVKIEIVNGLGEKTVQEVPQSAKECAVDIKIAVPFLENLEQKTKEKVASIKDSIDKGSVGVAYMNKIRDIAELEANMKLYDYVSSINFTIELGKFQLSVKKEFENSYNTSLKIYEGLTNKIKSLQDEIDSHIACVEKQQSNIENCATKFASMPGNTPAAGNSNNVMKKCKAKLGSDPIGNVPTTGECPGYSKNCYWVEYTKLLQTVSLMPIPELNPLDMSRRLFRYYPVAITIPVPVIPPGVLPTLAMGIPDPLISIPLPFVWKHIVSISTPFGLFVVWIALAGGIVPNPFIMFIDEQNKPMFLLTPKGPVNLPASQLLILPNERLSLLEFIKFTDPLKVSLSSPIGKLLSGSTRGNPFDPDDPTTVIDNIKGKIKKSLDDLEIDDPSWAGQSEYASKRQADLKRALEFIPPDATVIKEALSEVFKTVEDAVDDIEISSIIIPKNAKYTAMELPPVAELLETFSGLLNSALGAPANLGGAILDDIGAGVKTLDVKKKLNQLARVEMSKPSLKQSLSDIDVEIDELEAGLDVDVSSEDVAAAKKEAVLKRTRKAKKVAVEAMKEVANNITPAMLGFVSSFVLPLDLPEPCYTSISLPAMPPWVALAIGLIKQAPSLIEAVPDEELADLLSGVLNLEKALPSAERLFYSVFETILSIIPDLVLPTGFDSTLLKQIKDSILNWLRTFKLRLPKPGLPAPIVIPGSTIKTLIKAAISVFLAGLLTVILEKFNEAITAIGPDRVIKIYAVLTIIKLLLGADLHKITGADIKAFIKSLLEGIAYPPLDSIKTIIVTATAIAGEFKSIKESFSLPDPIDKSIEALRQKPPFFEIGAEQLKGFVDPLFLGVVKTVSENVPYPAILLGCSFPLTRMALTKINPIKATEILPPWEGLTLKNIPYVVWLDQLAASSQRYSILASDYVIPYFTPPTS